MKRKNSIRIIFLALGLSAVSLALGSTSVPAPGTESTLLGVSPASADVYACTAYVQRRYNWAESKCRGEGSFRVEARCNSPKWPYTTVVKGRIVKTPSSSSVYCPRGSSIVSAWTVAI